MISTGEGSRSPARGDEAAARSMYEPFLRLLPITGASISISVPEQHQSTIAISDEKTARVQELQYELEEGPHWVALRTARPVLVDDVRSHDDTEWPVFGAAIRETEVKALFAFPLLMGAVAVGVADLYRDTPGGLSAREIEAAMALASAVSVTAARLAVDSAARERRTESTIAPALRREVHQATGMTLVQLDVSATEAFDRLNAYASSTGRSVLDVARDVIARKLNLGELGN